MAGVSSCMKCSMFIFNFLFWVCGCIILGISIWIHMNESTQGTFDVDEDKYSSDYLLMTVGAIIMVLGFLGCCGAMKESRCMLLLFFIGLLVILLLQIVAGILGAVYKSEIDSAINATIENKLLSLKTDEQFQAEFREFEKQNKCCGFLNGVNDWEPNASFKQGCVCMPEDVETNDCPSFSGNKYVKSCRSVIVDFFEHHMVIIMGVAFGMAFVEVVGLVFSMSLYCQIQGK